MIDGNFDSGSLDYNYANPGLTADGSATQNAGIASQEATPVQELGSDFYDAQATLGIEPQTYSPASIEMYATSSVYASSSVEGTSPSPYMLWVPAGFQVYDGYRWVDEETLNGTTDTYTGFEPTYYSAIAGWYLPSELEYSVQRRASDESLFANCPYYLPIDENSEQINQVFQDRLGRAPSSDELQMWNLVFSGEFLNAAQFDAHVAGWPESRAYQSPPANPSPPLPSPITGGVSDIPAYVNNLYRHVLGKDASAEVIRSWQVSLLLGVPLESLVMQTVNSSAAQAYIHSFIPYSAPLTDITPAPMYPYGPPSAPARAVLQITDLANDPYSPYSGLANSIISMLENVIVPAAAQALSNPTTGGSLTVPFALDFTPAELAAIAQLPSPIADLVNSMRNWGDVTFSVAPVAEPDPISTAGFVVVVGHRDGSPVTPSGLSSDLINTGQVVVRYSEISYPSAPSYLIDGLPAPLTVDATGALRFLFRSSNGVQLVSPTDGQPKNVDELLEAAKDNPDDLLVILKALRDVVGSNAKLSLRIAQMIYDRQPIAANLAELRVAQAAVAAETVSVGEKQLMILTGMAIGAAKQGGDSSVALGKLAYTLGKAQLYYQLGGAGGLGDYMPSVKQAAVEAAAMGAAMLKVLQNPGDFLASTGSSTLNELRNALSTAQASDSAIDWTNYGMVAGKVLFDILGLVAGVGGAIETLGTVANKMGMLVDFVKAGMKSAEIAPLYATLEAEGLTEAEIAQYASRRAAGIEAEAALEEIQSGTPAADLEMVAEVGAQAEADVLAGGGATKKASRWDEYTARNGKLEYETWSKLYDLNQVRAINANAAVHAYWEKLGWGLKEQTIEVRLEGELVNRRLDIADVATSRGIEYKTGQQFATKENLYEVARDAVLVQEEGWSIQWVFRDLPPSGPLKIALEEAGIQIVLEFE